MENQLKEVEEISNDIQKEEPKKESGFENLKKSEIVMKPFKASFIFLILLGMIILAILFVILGSIFSKVRIPFLILGILVLIASIIISSGCIVISPNQAYVFDFLGNYKGTLKKNGRYWVIPFYKRKIISLRLDTFNSNIIKVNDKIGNPIKIGCTILWYIKDTYKAIYEVEDYKKYLIVQVETALRHVGYSFPYEKINQGDICLKSGQEETNQVLKEYLQERMKCAGIEIVDAIITDLSYSAEIASTMLKKQSAASYVDAKEIIIHGVFDIFKKTVDSFAKDNIEINKEYKCKLISNMLMNFTNENCIKTIISENKKKEDINAISDKVEEIIEESNSGNKGILKLLFKVIRKII